MQPMFVMEFGLFSTTFKRVDGQTVIAPNALLASAKTVHNLRRSSSMLVHTTIYLYNMTDRSSPGGRRRTSWYRMTRRLRSSNLSENASRNTSVRRKTDASGQASPCTSRRWNTKMRSTSSSGWSIARTGRTGVGAGPAVRTSCGISRRVSRNSTYGTRCRCSPCSCPTRRTLA